jgi:DNA-3-methyladenine glycosylase
VTSRRGRALPSAFYGRDSLAVAPDLLHKLLVRDDPVHGRVAARIVEVEAYRGTDDPGSHGFRGPTPRTTTMFGSPGRLYVYFTYGMHWCANVVTGAVGESNAVLLRAAEPLQGLDAMRDRRPRARRDRDLCAGPARLTQALGITGADDGVDLRRGHLRVLDDGVAPPGELEWTTRIGLAPGRGDDRPWRCVVPGSRFLSRRSGVPR